MSGKTGESMKLTFYGRRKEIRHIIKTLESENYIEIFGMRGIGRTALLIKLHETFLRITDYYPIFIDRYRSKELVDPILMRIKHITDLIDDELAAKINLMLKGIKNDALDTLIGIKKLISKLIGKEIILLIDDAFSFSISKDVRLIKKLRESFKIIATMIYPRISTKNQRLLIEPLDWTTYEKIVHHYQTFT